MYQPEHLLAPVAVAALGPLPVLLPLPALEPLPQLGQLPRLGDAEADAGQRLVLCERAQNSP
jgi:hypothetical protein